MKKVFIVGSSGTTGLRLRNRLLERSDVELLEIDEKLRRDAGEIERLMGLSDFCFLCLPDEAAREMAALSTAKKTRLIDASTAHRCSDTWVYGFPELSSSQRLQIEKAKRVAVPGCHALGIIALTAPLTQTGLMPLNYPLCCTGITGYSGGGKQMIAEYESQETPLSPKQYAMAQSHKHLPEIVRHCNLSHAPVFSPIVSNFYSGMLISICLHTSRLTWKVSPDDIRDIYKSHYAAAALIDVVDDAPSSLYAEALSGRDDMQIYVSGNDERILVSALYDNLGKGASGAAIQCFNIMSGADERGGLKIS